MRLIKTTVVALGLAAAAGSAQAVTINSATSGLAGAGTTIDFSEGGVANGTLVTNQFAGLGASFSPAMTLLTSVSPRPNFAGPSLVNFGGNPFTIFNPFTIAFSATVDGASFAMTANNGTATISALLNGTAVSSFSTTTDTSANSFYGFSGFNFDAITVTASSPQTVALDNLSFNVATVPVPAALPMLMLGMFGLAVLGRRRAT